MSTLEGWEADHAISAWDTFAKITSLVAALELATILDADDTTLSVEEARDRAQAALAEMTQRWVDHFAETGVEKDLNTKIIEAWRVASTAVIEAIADGFDRVGEADPAVIEALKEVKRYQQEKEADDQARSW